GHRPAGSNQALPEPGSREATSEPETALRVTIPEPCAGAALRRPRCRNIKLDLARKPYPPPYQTTPPPTRTPFTSRLAPAELWGAGETFRCDRGSSLVMQR